MEISKGDLVLVRHYGDDGAWFEVDSVDGNDIVCNNGHDELFLVSRNDIYEVTQDDAVLM